MIRGETTNEKRVTAIWLCIALLVMTTSGCGAKTETRKSVKLDPDNPVSLTIWHYYNGSP
ncbi:MAG: hypothetical protein MRZ36_05165 [Eubacterium sp.]|nr:hypothetical protein [Eubacterium sp.]